MEINGPKCCWVVITLLRNLLKHKVIKLPNIAKILEKDKI